LRRKGGKKAEKPFNAAAGTDQNYQALSESD